MHQTSISKVTLLLAVVVAVAVGILFLLRPTPVSNEPDVQAAVDSTTAPGPDLETPPQPAAAGDSSSQTAETDASLLNTQALNAWHSGDITGAMTLFEQAIERFPDDPEPFSNYGRLLTLMVNYQSALPLLERARDLRPGDAQTWLDLATLYERAQVLEKSWAAQAEAAKLVGSEAITRDERGRFVIEGHSIW